MTKLNRVVWEDSQPVKTPNKVNLEIESSIFWYANIPLNPESDICSFSTEDEKTVKDARADVVEQGNGRDEAMKVACYNDQEKLIGYSKDRSTDRKKTPDTPSHKERDQFVGEAATKPYATEGIVAYGQASMDKKTPVASLKQATLCRSRICSDNCSDLDDFNPNDLFSDDVWSDEKTGNHNAKGQQTENSSTTKTGREQPSVTAYPNELGDTHPKAHLADDSIRVQPIDIPTELDSVFTSVEFIDTPRHRSLKFLIADVIDLPSGKLLLGEGVICYVSGEWADVQYRVNDKATALDCFCCPVDNSTAFVTMEQLMAKIGYSLAQQNITCNGEKVCNAMDEMCTNKVLFSDCCGATCSVVFVCVNDEHGYLILEDDLMTVTNFCSAVECFTRPVLAAKIADFSFNFAHPAAVVGIVAHSVIEQALMAKNFTLEFLIRAAKTSISENLVQIYSSNIDERAALNEILKMLKNICSFQDYSFSISDSEKKLSSLLFNIKGNVDALGWDVVLEFKTGKYMSASHRAQAIMYALILKDRFKRDFSSYLYYVSTKNLIKVSLKHSEVRALLCIRNRLTRAYEFCNCKASEYEYADHYEKASCCEHAKNYGLQNLLKDCRCSPDSTCKTVSKILALPSTHFLKIQWISIALEENARCCRSMIKCRYESQKENYLVLRTEMLEPPKNLYVTLFVLSSASNNSNSPMFSTLKGTVSSPLSYVRLCKGIIERTEESRVEIRLSENIELKKHREMYIQNTNSDMFFKYMRWSLINVAYPRYMNKAKCELFYLPGEKEDNAVDEIRLNEIQTTGMCKVGKMEDAVLKTGNSALSVSRSRNDELSSSNDSFYVSDCSLEDTDQLGDEVSIFHGGDYEMEDVPVVKDSDNSNTIYGATYEHYKPDELQDNVGVHVNSQAIDVCSSTLLDGKPTQMKHSTYKTAIPELFKPEFLALNSDQQMALFLSLNCEKYRIIHGMPGTGKSTLISLLIRIIAHLGKKCLLICYTNLALTNLIKKLDGLKIHRARKTEINFSSISEISKYYSSVDLVAGTCFSFADAVFINRRFDYCIIDEGSQLHLLLSLIPLSLCNKFVLVGDHLQLKPLSKGSRHLNMSLFEYLLGSDHSVLRHQYRMGTEIMRLSNTLFYSGRLIGENRPSVVRFVDTGINSYEDFVSSISEGTILCYFNSQIEKTRKLSSLCVETVDRFQGSEDDHVYVVFDPISICEVMASKERLNVALTRARKTLVLVGNRKLMMGVPILKRLLELL